MVHMVLSCWTRSFAACTAARVSPSSVGQDSLPTTTDGEVAVRLFHEYMQGYAIPIATGCSGAETPILLTQYLQEAFYPTMDINHKFSCERSREKRQFIAAHPCLLCLVLPMTNCWEQPEDKMFGGTQLIYSEVQNLGNASSLCVRTRSLPRACHHVPTSSSSMSMVM